MFFELIKDVICDNSFLYASIVVFIFSSFVVSLLISLIKSFKIAKTTYYSTIFRRSFLEQSFEKSKDNAILIKKQSVVANIFLVGLKTLSENLDGKNFKNSEHLIKLTKSTMKIELEKELLYFNQGFNFLSFNAILIPYASITLSLWSIVEIFNTVDIGVLTLSMFLKPLFIMVMGLIMAGISSIVYLVSKDRIETIESISNLFINEFTHKIYKKYYKWNKNEKE